ncbi:MAG: recombinase family protein [Amphiplicatus sp.]
MKRCAIYTRKSTEEGLDQTFNSLDAQREACEAYVASQRHEGWKLIKTRFDDAGLSGGTMDRPALQALLKEIDEGSVDIIVVYKVDRLTRSLADFAKLVERFDATGASFVSVTQQFNTSNSMGRLTLNVLLSFAQFEREVTAERIRDKIAASRRKGMWTGGLPPLGYDNVDKNLVVNEREARTVRRLYDLYLETDDIRAVIETAKREGLASKKRADPKSGGALTRGPIYFILSNPIYAGLVRAGKDLYEGEHEAIVDKTIWEAVQAKRLGASQRAGTKSSGRNPWAGKLFADGGRLTPSHASKGRRRYRYYVSRVGETGVDASRGRWRLNANELEAAILAAIDAWLASPEAGLSILQDGVSAGELKTVQTRLDALKDAEASLPAAARLRDWAARIDRIDIDEEGLTLSFAPKTLLDDLDLSALREVCVIRSAIKIGPRGQGLRLILGATKPASDADGKVVTLIKKAVAWRDRWFVDASLRLVDIAREEGMDIGDVSRFLPLVYLAPDIVRAVLDGDAPADLNVELLRRIDGLPASWSAQRRLFGFQHS